MQLLRCRTIPICRTFEHKVGVAGTLLIWDNAGRCTLKTKADLSEGTTKVSTNFGKKLNVPSLAYDRFVQKLVLGSFCCTQNFLAFTQGKALLDCDPGMARIGKGRVFCVPAATRLLL